MDGTGNESPRHLHNFHLFFVGVDIKAICRLSKHFFVVVALPDSFSSATDKIVLTKAMS